LRNLCFIERGRQIRAITGDSITTWDSTLREGVEDFQPRGTNRGQFSPDATRFAVGDRNGGVTIWDTQTNQIIRKIPFDRTLSGPLDNLGFSPDGRQLVIIRMRPAAEPEFGERTEGYWEFWLHSVDDGRLLARFDTTSRDRHFMIPGVQFRPDGSEMALVHYLYYDADSPAQLRVWDLKQYVELPPVELPWRDSWLWGYSADGANLLVVSTVGDSDRVSTFDAATRRLQSTRELPGRVYLYDPARNRRAVFNKTDLVFYDLETGKEDFRLQGFEAYNRAESPDGRRLVAEVFSGNRSQLVLWSLENGRRLLTLDSPQLATMTFSADGRRLLALSYDGPSGYYASQIWDATPLPDSE
jgi:WD40 repeat protein